MPDALRLDGRVAIVTGAGGGIGRAHAVALAARGARVVVNDLGGDMDGSGESSSPAEAVADEIRALGGEAIASTTSVIAPEGGEAIAASAFDAWGRVDILINNAGVLGERSGILEVPDDKIDSVLATHLRGAFSVIRPVWRHMVDQGGGRIVNTSSGTVFGIVSGASYQAAKAGLLGLTRNLALQGAPHDISVNALLPTAFTRMTNQIPQEALRSFMESRFTPERVAEFAVLMVHDSFPYTGEFFAVGGGRVARVVLGVTEGAISETCTAEDYAQLLESVMDTSSITVPPDRAAEFNLYMGKLGFGVELETSLGRTAGSTAS